MIQAQLHGKAPSELTWSEDILTSNIFGLLKYLSTPETTVDILRCSFNLDNRSLVIPDDTERIIYFFWPRLLNSEPDLVLLLDSSHGTHVIGIEAKYLSGKSSSEDLNVEEDDRNNRQRDQLAREIEDLFEPENYQLLGISKERILSINMIYLTLESYMPREELQDTINSLRNQENQVDGKEVLFWLSWKSIHGVLRERIMQGSDGYIKDDLLKYLTRKDLISYSGYSVRSVLPVSWNYSREKQLPVHHVIKINWQYRSI